MTEAQKAPYVNKWGEEVLGEYVEESKSNEGGFDNKMRWQLKRLREKDYSRRVYNQEFEFVAGSVYNTQTSTTVPFGIQGAIALRDMLSAAIKDYQRRAFDELNELSDAIGWEY